MLFKGLYMEQKRNRDTFHEIFAHVKTETKNAKIIVIEGNGKILPILEKEKRVNIVCRK